MSVSFTAADTSRGPEAVRQRTAAQAGMYSVLRGFVGFILSTALPPAHTATLPSSSRFPHRQAAIVTSGRRPRGIETAPLILLWEPQVKVKSGTQRFLWMSRDRGKGTRKYSSAGSPKTHASARVPHDAVGSPMGSDAHQSERSGSMVKTSRDLLVRPHVGPTPLRETSSRLLGDEGRESRSIIATRNKNPQTTRPRSAMVYTGPRATSTIVRIHSPRQLRADIDDGARLAPSTPGTRLGWRTHRGGKR
jgi:hypothetical protein